MKTPQKRTCTRNKSLDIFSLYNGEIFLWGYFSHSQNTVNTEIIALYMDIHHLNIDFLKGEYITFPAYIFFFVN